MICIIDKRDFRFENTVVTIGKFDGMHIGHRALIEKACRYKERGLKTVVFRLDISPKGISLRSESERIEILRSLGTDIYIRYPFTPLEAAMSANEFIDRVLVDKLGAKTVVVGEDFRFGHNREGNIDLLKKTGMIKGFETFVEKKVVCDGKTVSSSLIRQLLANGDTAGAGKMLGTD